MRVQSLGLARYDTGAHDDQPCVAVVPHTLNVRERSGVPVVHTGAPVPGLSDRPQVPDLHTTLHLVDRRAASEGAGRRVAMQHTAAAAAGVAAAIVLVTAVWRVAVSPRVDAPVRSVPSPFVPTMATGTSFIVNVAVFGAEPEAHALASRLEALGLPAFTWATEDGASREVLIGPYVGRDEAERVRRGVLQQGYVGARLDEDRRLPIVSRTVALGGSDGSASTNPTVLLVAAPGRLSVVLETPDEPRQLSGKRADDTTFNVEAGPFASSLDPQVWHAPSNVQLVKDITVSPTKGPGGVQHLQARLTLSAYSDASVRVVGRRLYIDISRAEVRSSEMLLASMGGAALEAPTPPPGAKGLAAASATDSLSAAPPRAKPSADEAAEYRTAVLPIVERFGEISSFLTSSISTASPEILAALAETLRELEQATRAAPVPEKWRHVHGSLVSAVGLAAIAVGPEYAGDRAARLREAIGHFEIVTRELAGELTVGSRQ